jgi:hypothetical protein
MRYGLAVLMVLGLAACDSKPPEKTVFDAQVQAIKKARSVEGTLHEAAERQRENVEKADGDDAGRK